MKVEIRIPTYKRPNLLRRALQSLILQTHENWVCRVLDDSPSHEAAEICRNSSDDRILYEPNDVNLGISRNIDRSFSAPPLTGSDFMCVLEDDNYYFANCLAENITALQASCRDIIVRNQLIERMISRDEPGLLTNCTSFDGQYLDGPLSHRDLFRTFFYSTGANNSSLFWRCGVRLDFSTMAYLSDVVAQERLRTLCIDRDVVVGMEPLIVWRDNGDETLRPKLGGPLEWRKSQLSAAADERAIYRALSEYLVELKCMHLAFSPLVGPFSSERERVFWRVGIQVAKDYRNLGTKQRWSLNVKRFAAQLGTLASGYAPKLRIDPKTRRLAI